MTVTCPPANVMSLRITFFYIVLFWSFQKTSLAFISDFHIWHCYPKLLLSQWKTKQLYSTKLPVQSPATVETDGGPLGSDAAACFDDVISQRYSCTRFQKNDYSSLEHHQVLQEALKVLDLSRRAPSGFNVQPWRAIMVSSPEAKEKLSKYALGNNPDRIRDSDCTVVFLADKECGREMSRFGSLIRQRDEAVGKATNRTPISVIKIRTTQFYVLLFSSGYPFPRFISAPFSFFVRLGVATVSAITRRRILVPSLSNAECWASKNCMLFAMSYILGCTSRNLATAPMEGFNAGGIRKAFGIPKRFAVPLIVSTGKPLVRVSENATEVEGPDVQGSSVAPKHLLTDRSDISKISKYFRGSKYGDFFRRDDYFFQ